MREREENVDFTFKTLMCGFNLFYLLSFIFFISLSWQLFHWLLPLCQKYASKRKKGKMQKPHFRKQATYPVCDPWPWVDRSGLWTSEMTTQGFIFKKEKKGGPSLPRIMEVNICRCRALQMCWGFGTCLCRILCRTERIRMKYWVHLWISGAERPLVRASACIFSWWKPLDGSFLLAASLNSESQKCNASWKKKKKNPKL